MRLFFASAAVALIVLYLVDLELNKGRYADMLLSALRGMARSMGIQ